MKESHICVEAIVRTGKEQIARSTHGCGCSHHFKEIQVSFKTHRQDPE